MNARFVPEAPPQKTIVLFDSGLREYQINGVDVRVNMNDKGVIRRLTSLPDDVGDMLDSYETKGKQFDGKIDINKVPMKSGEEGPTGVDFGALSDEEFDAISERTDFIIEVDHAVDVRIKTCLAEAFGITYDAVNAIFQGVSALALDSKGNYILTNFMKAIFPLIEEANKIEAKEVDDLVGDKFARRARNRRTQEDVPS